MRERSFPRDRTHRPAATGPRRAAAAARRHRPPHWAGVPAHPPGSLRGRAQNAPADGAQLGQPCGRRSDPEGRMNRGEVVEVVWYYSDMSGSKRRPAVVIQADFLNALIDDTVLVQITSTQHGI